MTARRYESVAAITSLSPANWTRTPVSTGRASSREAARATRLIVSSSGSRLDDERRRLADLRQAREIFGVERLERVARAARRDVDDRLGHAMLERNLVCRQQARNVDERAARQDDRSFALHLRRHGCANRELHVGRRETQLAVTRLEQDPREDLDRGTRRQGAHNGREAVHELVLRARNPQVGTDCGFTLDHLQILTEVVGAVDRGGNGRKRHGQNDAHVEGHCGGCVGFHSGEPSADLLHTRGEFLHEVVHRPVLTNEPRDFGRGVDDCRVIAAAELLADLR